MSATSTLRFPAQRACLGRPYLALDCSAHSPTTAPLPPPLCRPTYHCPISPPHPHGYDSQAYQGVVLSVFFGGYATTQVLGGKLADQFGGKMVLAAGVACECVRQAGAGAGWTRFLVGQGSGGRRAARRRGCVCERGERGWQLRRSGHGVTQRDGAGRGVTWRVWLEVENCAKRREHGLHREATLSLLRINVMLSAQAQSAQTFPPAPFPTCSVVCLHVRHAGRRGCGHVAAAGGPRHAGCWGGRGLPVHPLPHL